MSLQMSDSYDHVIVGGGTAADKAARAIAEARPGASILLASADSFGPVYRPDLSKTLWQKSGDEAKVESSLLGTDEVEGVDLVLGAFAAALDTEAHTVHFESEDGQATVTYGTLLLATGSTPNMPTELDDPRVVYLRGAADYEALRASVGEGANAVIAGGGYIGSELAAAFSGVGAKTTVLFRGERLLEQMFPASILERIEASCREHDVELRPGFEVSEIAATDDGVFVSGPNGEKVQADVLAVGFGVHPNVRLAEDAGLEVDGGVLVDDHMRTTAADVYAAGDIALFDDPLFGRRRVEHVDNAEHTGEVAGKNMAGGDETNDYTPIFWSDLFDDGYEAIGTLDASADTIERWNDDGTAAVVYYVRDGRPIGVLLWNTWDSTGAAKDVVAAVNEGKKQVEDLKGAIEPG